MGVKIGNKYGLWIASALLCTTVACQQMPSAVGSAVDGGGGVAGVALLTQMAGLWAGPATTTPLGPIPIMNMDFRAANPHVLFGRVDLNDDNSLRFDFSIEAPNQAPVLIFRNGGYFLGLLRDSRTQLVEVQAAPSPSYRFCALQGGCDYIDARFTFSDATHLTLDVKVLKMQHVLWYPVRKEARSLPTPFPADEQPQGNGDAPFPTLPQLQLTVTWPKPLPSAADILVVLSTTPCDYLTPANLGCTASRSLFGTGAAGAVSAELLFDQIHPGPYLAVAILDRTGSLKGTELPVSGDGISLPNQGLTIAPSGTTQATLAIPLVVP